MADSVILFHTDGCHLCEQAAALLQQANIAFQTVDIITDPELVERYGIRIPVVFHHGNELGWPFDSADLQQFTGA
ncbi:glutaredoxin family protein [Ferrimonas lipolytica]|uniref:Glutaredoxin family protein n=1 Tax=Ferrimonas lipolytica TaxID=2724191 RepID=A0A6H1UD69_9GAMM|nr:glutaredoxin family protein [Ferrimonas lipolytica]QIZ76569.1 glutaredoxin family protein [Ferrimonas lipolytica]